MPRIPLNILKNYKTKVVLQHIVYGSQDRKGHLPGHLILTHKVTRECNSSVSYAIDFPDPKNLRNKKKIMVVALIVPMIGKVNCMVT